MSRVADIPPKLLHRDKRESFLVWLMEQEIDERLKLSIYSDWSLHINQPLRIDDLNRIKNVATEENGET